MLFQDNVARLFGSYGKILRVTKIHKRSKGAFSHLFSFSNLDLSPYPRTPKSIHTVSRLCGLPDLGQHFLPTPTPSLV